MSDHGRPPVYTGPDWTPWRPPAVVLAEHAQRQFPARKVHLHHTHVHIPLEGPAVTTYRDADDREHPDDEEYER